MASFSASLKRRRLQSVSTSRTYFSHETTARGTLPGRSNDHRHDHSRSATSVTSSLSYAPPTNLRENMTITSTSSVLRGQDDYDDLELDSEVVMAVDMTQRGVVGCAYYVARTETLHFMEEIRAGGSDTIEALRLFIDPTVVLVSSTCDEKTLDCLDLRTHSHSGSREGRIGDQTRLPYLLESRPRSEFSYAGSKSKLLNLNIGRSHGPVVTFVVPGDVTSNGGLLNANDISASRHDQEKLLRLSAHMNTESRVSVGCAGAILTYLQRRRATAFLPNDEAAANMFRVATIEMFSLSGTMFVNEDTMLSLQIISIESHPNSQQQGPSSKGWSTGGAKEGLSVFGLFQPLAKTPQGRTHLRQIFLRPSTNLEVINERLDSIGVLLRPENAGLSDRLTASLTKIKNIRVVTINLRKGICGGRDRQRRLPALVWTYLRHFVYHALRVTDTMAELQGAERLAISSRIREKFDRRQLALVGNMISEIVDLDASVEQRRTIVRQGIDEELDEAKRTYDGIEDLLSRIADVVANEVPAELGAKVNVIFFPQIGFLISVGLNGSTGSGVYEGAGEDPWEKMFVTETNAYYKNNVITELDQEYGDIYGRICDREIEIVQTLGERVLEHETMLTGVSDICGELDCIVALAKGASLYKLVRPTLSDNNALVISGGRHILQELTVASFVANDTHIVGGTGKGDSGPTRSQHTTQRSSTINGPSMLLLTGPYYSGKSVYLKQVAIITYMAHVGSFVPANSAHIGLTDKLLTRISTRESVSRGHSSFVIDLQQVSIALKLATRRSLLVIDEFGKGTETFDGAGLAAAVFQHLLRRGPERPRVIGATHFHEIFENGFLPPQPALSFGHFEVRIDEGAGEVDRQVAYLYTYKEGRSISSLGTCCAALNGVAPAIIERAEHLITLAAKGDDLVEACAKLPERELVELEECEQLARALLVADMRHEPRKVLDDLFDLASANSE